MVKTYSRKQQEYKEIDDVHQRCRLCLARTDAEHTVPIFERVDDVCAALPLRIMICVGYEISQDDCLPNIICTSCHHELEKYYKFRKKCEESYLKLKSHYNATIKKKDRIIEEGIFHYGDKIVEEGIFNDDDKIVETNETCMTLEDTNIEDVTQQLLIADVLNVEEQGVSKTNTDAAENVEETTEIQVIEQSNDTSPDISTFLSAILVELGILVKDHRGLHVHDQGVTSFELETGDDDQIMFELVESDEADETAGPASIRALPIELAAPAAASRPADHNITEGKDKKKHAKKNHESRNMQKEYDKKNGAWCGVCGRQFSSGGAARRHGGVHARARPHACPHAACRKTFAQKAVMERHRLLHQEERPFKCPSCPKSYTQRGALAAHARAHLAPHARALALHACTLCDRLFLYASGLSRHMLTHSGRTFQCPTCSRLFNDRSSLARHSRNAHPSPSYQESPGDTAGTTEDHVTPDEPGSPREITNQHAPVDTDGTVETGVLNYEVEFCKRSGTYELDPDSARAWQSKDHVNPEDPNSARDIDPASRQGSVDHDTGCVS